MSYENDPGAGAPGSDRLDDAADATDPASTGAASAPLDDAVDGVSIDEHADVLGLDDLELELQMARAERDEYLDALRRLQADFENYRKRVQREQSESAGRATAGLIDRLLPVLDAFDLALRHASDAGDESELTGAVSQIAALINTALERDGLERIDDPGTSFDPTIHDAVAHEARQDDDPPGPVVAEVLRAGYRLKGRVLRPAMVRVRG